MNVEILVKKENPLLSRLEVEGKIEFNAATPSGSDVKKALAKEIESNDNLIVIKKISTTYGKKGADFIAYQYFSEDDMKQIEKIVEAPAEKKEAPAEKKEAPAEKKEAPAEKKEAPAEKKEAPVKEE